MPRSQAGTLCGEVSKSIVHPREEDVVERAEQPVERRHLAHGGQHPLFLTWHLAYRRGAIVQCGDVQRSVFIIRGAEEDRDHLVRHHLRLKPPNLVEVVRRGRCSLLEEGEHHRAGAGVQLGEERSRRASPIRDSARHEHPLRPPDIMVREAELLEIVLTLARRAASHGLHGGQKQSDQNADNGDYDQLIPRA